MPFYLSPKTIKQQAKILVKNWPFSSIKTTRAREFLCQLYGYKSNHNYQKLAQHPTLLTPITESVLLLNYLLWVKKLADLGSMNQIQAKKLIHQFWPAYLAKNIPLSAKLYQCRIKFYGACLDFFLSKGSRAKSNRWHTYTFDDRPSVKDSLEALGVPHPEVGAIKVNGDWVDFTYLLRNDDQIEIHPNPHKSALLPYLPKGRPSFLLDLHLGGLARYLRMAGFDCFYDKENYGDQALAEMAVAEKRILLSRDIGLLKRKNIQYGHWIRNTISMQQFKEVVSHYHLVNYFKPMSLCIRCNGSIITVDKQTVKILVPSNIYQWQQVFHQCNACHQVYWKGSHYKKINDIIAQAKNTENKGEN